MANHNKRKKQNEPMRTLEANIRNQRQARENARDQVVIGFSFASDWLKRWHEFSETNHRAQKCD